MHLINVIDFLIKVDELEIAKNLLKTFAKYSNSLDQYNELGMLFEKINAYHESIEMLKKCYDSDLNKNQLYAIRSNFAKVYNKINEPTKSLYYSNINNSINPADNEIKLEQSFSYYLIGDFEKSLEIQNKLLQDSSINDDLKTKIEFNMSSFDIKKGLFKQGVKKLTLNGKKMGLWPNIKKPFKRWTGENTNKTLLVYAEQGIGDQIIHVRFMNELKKRNINAIWVGGDDDIRKIFKFANYNTIDNDNNLDLFKEYVYTDSSSLVVLLELGLDQLWQNPYLKLNYEYVKKWQELLPKKFITVRWNGNKNFSHNLQRKIPFNILYDTIKNCIPNDVDIISLQLDENQKDLISVNIENWFDTTAIQNLALMNITSCTSTAHSAGAIGANCIVLPPITTYYPWQYLTKNKNSYWYGKNLKVFVQNEWNNWNNPMESVKHELLHKFQLCI